MLWWFIMSPEVLIELSRDVALEQAEVQRTKHTSRPMFRYNESLYPIGFELPPTFGKISVYEDGEHITPPATIWTIVHSLAQNLQVGTEEAPLRWLDVGGGTGRAQSEFKCQKSDSDRKLRLETINQDVVEDPYIADLHPTMLRFFEGIKPFMPSVYPVDICVAAPEEKSHFITSVFPIPYWNNPLQGMVNMYNNLENGGVMSIATDNSVSWSSLIRYCKDRPKVQSPIDDFIDSFIEHGIPFSYATTKTSLVKEKHANRKNISSLTIHKTDDADLALNAKVERAVTIPTNVKSIGSHKVVMYDLPPNKSLVSF